MAKQNRLEMQNQWPEKCVIVTLNFGFSFTSWGFQFLGNANAKGSKIKQRKKNIQDVTLVNEQSSTDLVNSAKYYWSLLGIFWWTVKKIHLNNST